MATAPWVQAISTKLCTLRGTGVCRCFWFAKTTVGKWQAPGKISGKHRSLIPYAEPFGFAARSVDGNDPLDVYHSTRWARETALVGQPVFLDCMTFRIGTYSSHFGETRPDIEREMEKWKARDPLVRMAEWLTSHDLASAGDLERFEREEQERIESAFQQVVQEVKQ